MIDEVENCMRNKKINSWLAVIIVWLYQGNDHSNSVASFSQAVFAAFDDR